MSSSSTSHNLASHGRGGAGNMVDSRQTPPVDTQDLETPTLKKPIVTTGRGGTGNMARNDDPNETRRRQDVAAVPRRPSYGAQHAGRGGAGNVFKNDETVELARKNTHENAVDEDVKAQASKGKHWFFGKKSSSSTT